MKKEKKRKEGTDTIVSHLRPVVVVFEAAQHGVHHQEARHEEKRVHREPAAALRQTIMYTTSSFYRRIKHRLALGRHIIRIMHRYRVRG